MDWMAKMADEAKNKPIFLCGGSSNEAEIRDMCDKVIWLKTTEATIRQRINNPRDHNYGTKPHELDAAIESNSRGEIAYSKNGAIIIDATQPLNDVAEEILLNV